jgi:hypothetical protein
LDLLVFLVDFFAMVVCIFVGEHEFGAKDLLETLIDAELLRSFVASASVGRSKGRRFTLPILCLPLIVILRFVQTVRTIKFATRMLVM